ncbi:hypothetical protein EDC91_1441 [Shewanella fodinae]|uniref:Uncharacterized protein n=1 Tax=Shewanella fodinae TaxID=552357 RepID=A0A4R2F789_9GAMM|nr:hypothetical protein EDC91_1441 [Shewanella fodinae]
MGNCQIRSELVQIKVVVIGHMQFNIIYSSRA